MYRTFYPHQWQLQCARGRADNHRETWELADE